MQGWSHDGKWTPNMNSNKMAAALPITKDGGIQITPMDHFHDILSPAMSSPDALLHVTHSFSKALTPSPTTQLPHRTPKRD